MIQNPQAIIGSPKPYDDSLSSQILTMFSSSHTLSTGDSQDRASTVTAIIEDAVFNHEDIFTDDHILTMHAYAQSFVFEVTRVLESGAFINYKQHVKKLKELLAITFGKGNTVFDSFFAAEKELIEAIDKDEYVMSDMTPLIEKSMDVVFFIYQFITSALAFYVLPDELLADVEDGNTDEQANDVLNEYIYHMTTGYIQDHPNPEQFYMNFEVVGSSGAAS